jgi:hypothetical protein
MSYAATTTITPINSSDANFRAWGSAVSAKLASMGFIQTADTGQINWGTVLAPLAINTSQGYEIWRFNDTLQATAPVYFKLEYGSGSAINNPAFWFQIGSGSNGSGTLTGVPNTRTQFIFTATATAINAYWSGDAYRCVFALKGASLATSFIMSLERTIDSTGVVTGEGVLITFLANSTWSQQAWNATIGPYTTIYEGTLGALGPQQTPLGVSGTQLAIYPVFHNKGVFLPFGLNLFAYIDATIAAGITLTFSAYSVNHIYMPIGAPSVTNTLQRTTAALSSIMIRYE